MKDPVCGMTVTPETAAAAWEHEGETYYFCSRRLHGAVPRGSGAVPGAIRPSAACDIPEGSVTRSGEEARCTATR